MTAAEVKQIVLETLGRIAPEADPSAIQPAASFRDQLDLDSMDVLNFVLALHDRLGVEIPEADYAKLMTLDGAVAYLSARQRAPSDQSGATTARR